MRGDAAPRPTTMILQCKKILLLISLFKGQNLVERVAARRRGGGGAGPIPTIKILKFALKVILDVIFEHRVEIAVSAACPCAAGPVLVTGRPATSAGLGACNVDWKWLAVRGWRSVR